MKEANCKEIFYASSYQVYGNNTAKVTEDSPLEPVTLKGTIQTDTEALIL